MSLQHGIEIELTPQQIQGRQLRKLRKASGFSQKELAARLGHLTPWVKGVETGVDEIDPHTLWYWRMVCGEMTTIPDKLPINANPPAWHPPTGSALREVRRNACYTQVELAAKLHCSHSYVCQVERGKCPVSASVGRRWLRACGLPTSAQL